MLISGVQQSDSVTHVYTHIFSYSFPYGLLTEDEMAGWHHRLNGYEFEQTLGDSEGQGSLVCCSPWGRKELDTS